MRSIFSNFKPRKNMKCLNPAVHFNGNETINRDFSVGKQSLQIDDCEKRSEISNIEEAESSLREGGCLNYEEARALLGRLEYQRGNKEAALHVFDGINISVITPKIKASIARRIDRRKSRSHWDAPLMSIHAVSLLMEAVFLKARAYNDIGKFLEAAQSCTVILDIVESASPNGLPEVFCRDCKLQETVCKSVELLPELWKLADHPHRAISSYRRALLGRWNIDIVNLAKLRKEFAIYLLYGGFDVSSLNSNSQMDDCFAPKNNVEEAILLLMVLLSDFNEKIVEWDPSVIEHLTFALSISGQLIPLANQLEMLLPGVLNRNERYYILALCYLGEGDNLSALNLTKKILVGRNEGSLTVKALFLASKICTDFGTYARDGVLFSRMALAILGGNCDSLGSVANLLLGVSLSAQAKLPSSDFERVSKTDEALEVLEKAEKTMKVADCRVLYNLSLENAEQRKLDVAIRYAKWLLKLEAGSNAKSWILAARILSAQKKFHDALEIINAAIDQSEKWSHGELLYTKAKIQIAQGKLKKAVETYTALLSVIRLWTKNSSIKVKWCSKITGEDRKLEMKAWYDLANVYTSMSHWKDAEVCISKLMAISPFSALGWHATGKFQEAKGLLRESLSSYSKALDLEHTHVPSLISTAIALKDSGGQPFAIVRSFLTEALRLDRTSHAAWLNLGLLYQAEGSSASDAVECFQAAAILEESAPVEPFR